MSVIISPNMSLPVPVTGVEPGPNYANDINASLNIVDAHTHAPGSGVPVTPQGLNINSNLSIENNDLTSVSGVQFSAPASSALLTRLYTAMQSGGGITDLFYNDAAGNVIPLTKAGVVNATLASIPGESYSGGTFTWVQGAGSTTPANFDIGSITIRPNTAGTTYGITVSPPSAIASSYDIILPALPSVPSYLTIDAAGNVSSSPTVASIAAAVNPSGAVIMYGGASAPTGYLLCDGSSYATATYASLFSAIGYTYGGFGANFNVPDARGIFVRGAGTNGTLSNANGTPFAGTLGTLQDDQMQGHNHYRNTADTPEGVMESTGGATAAGGGTYGFNALTFTGGTVTDTVHGPTRDGYETAPANICLTYIIKT
jgi:microcystin-dependent protein